MNDGRGVVYLVGAGPGDPGLITVRGRQALDTADVVIHDRLANNDLLSGLREPVKIIDVGKGPGCFTVDQSEIDQMLIDYARQKLQVVRLKGGDPFVFGRGYEELTACRAAGIKCVVIPGVSSAFAGPASAGIPITTRFLVRSVAVITGRVARQSTAGELDYEALAKMDTIIILMGRSRLGQISHSLIAAGRDPETPAVCIEWATTDKQRLAAASLRDIAEEADRAGLKAPVVTVVGQVAGLVGDAASDTSSQQ